MPNVHLTRQMESYVQGQIKSDAPMPIRVKWCAPESGYSWSGTARASSMR